MALDSREVIDEQILKAEADIQQLKARRNTYTPAAMLPIDILSYIFQFPADLEGHTREELLVKYMVPITQVCHRWRTIAIETATLWTRVPLGYLQWTEELLRRSKGAGIDVENRLIAGGQSIAGHPSEREALDCVFVNIGAVRRLSLRSIEQWEAQILFQAFNRSSGTLKIEDLTLTLTSNDVSGPTIGSSVLAALAGCGQMVPSTVQILVTLNNVTTLEVLHLSFSVLGCPSLREGDNGLSSADSQHHGRVEFPLLHDLLLTMPISRNAFVCTALPMSAILRPLSLHPPRKLNLECAVTHATSLSTLLHSVNDACGWMKGSSLQSLYLRFDAEYGEVFVAGSFSSPKMTKFVRDGDFSLHLLYQDFSDEEIFQQLFSGLPLHDLGYLAFLGCPMDIPASAWASTFGRLQRLQIVIMQDAELQKFLPALVEKNPFNDGLCFPGLRKFEAIHVNFRKDDNTSFAMLKDMLMRRREDARINEIRLTVCRFHPEQAEQLRKFRNVKLRKEVYHGSDSSDWEDFDFM
ncbi:unnamed protein product [Cyclocybe aegerita]|uniref:F-box domain-containing protein n=1 Tax=Cyclocybe aegerita TaxID=1973307 RepID=A0A8S0VZU7_CYCAE|nr:unnamed protein product [Cyclocybe aegerita]